MDDSGSTLRELFAGARRRQDDLSQLDPRSDEHRGVLRQTIADYEACRVSISRVALFSTNEEADDIATQDLQ